MPRRSQRTRQSPRRRIDTSSDDGASCIDLTEDEPNFIDLTSTPLRHSMVPVILPLSPAQEEEIERNQRRRNRRQQVEPAENSVEIISTPEPSSRLSPFSEEEVSSGVVVICDTSLDSTVDVIDVDSTDNRLAMADITTSPTPVKISCPICMDDDRMIKRSNRQLTSTVCGHIFCSTCIRQSIKTFQRCPTCRKVLRINQIHPIFL